MASNKTNQFPQLRFGTWMDDHLLEGYNSWKTKSKTHSDSGSKIGCALILDKGLQRLPVQKKNKYRGYISMQVVFRFT